MKALYRIPSEIYQELYIDPYIELYVSKTVEKMGGSFWEQVLWSSLAEGARETLTGSVFSAFKSSMMRASVNDIQSHKALSRIMDRSSIESDIRSQVDEMKAQLESTSLKDTGGELVISTLMLFSGFLMGTFIPVTLAGSLSPVVKVMVSSRIHMDSIRAILRDTVDIQEGLIPQPLVPWHFEYSDPTQAVWYHDLGQSLLDETRAISGPQKTVITQEMMEKLRALSPQSIVEEIAGRLGLPLNKVGDYLPEENTLVSALVGVFLDKIMMSAPITKLKEICRRNNIKGHSARGITKSQLVNLVINNIPNTNLVQNMLLWETSTYSTRRTLGNIINILAGPFYNFGVRLFSKKDKSFSPSTIDKLEMFFKEFSQISSKERKSSLDAIRHYRLVKGYYSLENIPNKPEWVLMKALLSAFSEERNKFVTPDELSIVIFPKNKGFFRAHFGKMKDGVKIFPQYDPYSVWQMEQYCLNQLQGRNLDYALAAIELWRNVRGDTLYYTPSNSPCKGEFDLINTLREGYEKLFGKSHISNTELGQLFNREPLFLNRLDPNNPSPFSGRQLDWIAKEIVAQADLVNNPSAYPIVKHLLHELGVYKGNNRLYYLKYERHMVHQQIIQGTHIDQYAPGWRHNSKLRALQVEILWRQQRGRCAISGKKISWNDILSGKVSVARHHIEFIKSKCQVKDLVLVLDAEHGSIKADKTKQSWISKLLAAKKAFEAGLAPNHWYKADRVSFDKDGAKFSRMDIEYYISLYL